MKFCLNKAPEVSTLLGRQTEISKNAPAGTSINGDAVLKAKLSINGCGPAFNQTSTLAASAAAQLWITCKRAGAIDFRGRVITLPFASTPIKPKGSFPAAAVVSKNPVAKTTIALSPKGIKLASKSPRTSPVCVLTWKSKSVASKSI